MWGTFMKIQELYLCTFNLEYINFKINLKIMFRSHFIYLKLSNTNETCVNKKLKSIINTKASDPKTYKESSESGIF